MTTATTAGGAAARELGPGDAVGSYRVIARIARGGMGEVFEARHTRAGHRVALKVLSADRRNRVGDAAVRRFVTEVEALSRLDHPGLVRILDCGDSAEVGPWIAMELVSGEVLRVRLDGGQRLPLASAVRTARRIASAIAAIHGAGIVHRDLKPDNVMVTPDEEVPGGERVKLLDFGIARLIDAGPHTTEGTVVGTAAYMAPEQCTGTGEIDDRADVYALGVLAFEMISGTLPFRGTAHAVMRAHLFGEPPLATLDALAPPALVELVGVLLAKEPSRRPAIAEVVRRLRAIEAEIAGPLEQEPAVGLADTMPARAVATATPATTRSRRWRWIAAAVAATGLVAAAAVVSHRHPARVHRTVPGMVAIAGARFRMGSTDAEVAAACTELPGGCLDVERPQLQRELPARIVTVTSFQLDRREVSNADYAAFLTAMAGLVDVRDDRDEHYPRFVTERSSGLLLVDLHPVFGGIARTPGGFEVRAGRAELPVVQVTWDGASQYCHYLGKRLPTEAEWELAARGTGGRRFPWGPAAPRCDGVVFGRGDPRGCPGLADAVAPVATAPQDVTSDGIHDLGGNVGEWVQDRFALPYYGDCGDCKDPVVDQAVPVPEDFRIFRGGTFRGVAYVTRATTRSRWKRSEVMNGVGFRCATR